jgi:hypothetical protein
MVVNILLLHGVHIYFEIYLIHNCSIFRSIEVNLQHWSCNNLVAKSLPSQAKELGIVKMVLNGISMTFVARRGNC